ncbi:FAD-dependent oxidoreductase [Mesorhizobium sp. M1C.F.Ca.ET.193.01.1.1]|uniref:FAD/NAD(P)-binding protein n=1 Tax=unclassified Mesorhizobium TaxID=325217 RepID=UPI000FD51723|nr:MULTISPECIES: FAD/NAD(P)-binding protein [unclassified Mesorhizobium]TGS95153.1 FAD-dependent oxidoreductase [bacterium M00.F.Ca.ET.177.01.1.1]TGQ51488.1 FAD-dependent oxidoreductase [Mesorhizobium sp. M1C.F.Ca.ET.210.01.1.1]TGQ67281.1 FAD-dependent oxidoreductase [Mesorhizobium sp. M1C.F.Ca.ET.212.01.1.1]TGR02164.1 FAD-dependent oxidoreductase [Mesorhizobium sp. M1C.F.Ca.ET.204.01.1.1]TGR22854.1 FAD-dependent oxidoreductase [Mesorhizobium sp. M1C.F.Ca.ET.196.01.1.1]
MVGRGNSIIIVGGGASGVVLAAHLLKSPNPDLRVTLIEKRPHFGQGMAYSTLLSAHVLNVRASLMSAHADDPENFARWVLERGLATPDQGPFYAPRSLYARYLKELLDELEERERETGRLRLIREQTLSISPTPSGVEVALANGTSVVGHLAALATGHDEQPGAFQGRAIRMGSDADTALDPEAPALVLGTGLSMVDAFLSLEQRGHRGAIVAVSRRGLLPSPHRKGNPIKLDIADIPLGTELSYFVGWFRNLIRENQKAGGDWRDVVDGLRPFNQKIWQNWSSSAKRRFVEHTKAWWDIHRHRMAPQVYERVTEAVRSGRIRLVAGRVVDIQPNDGFAVKIQQRGTQALETLEVARIYDCMGIARDISKTSNGVVRSLVERGLARPDPLRLGLDVTARCELIAADGTVSSKILAVGPLTRGTFFEIDAIPDIRVQCARLSKQLLG